MQNYIQLGVDDIISEDGYERNRLVSYADADVVLICFSLVDSNSFHNVSKKWYPEIFRHCAKMPIILVGTKLDLKYDQATLKELEQSGQKVVTRKQALDMAMKIGAKKFVHCSARTTNNLDNVFVEAANAVINQSAKCVIS